MPREERQNSSQAVGTILQRVEAVKKAIQRMDGRARTNCGEIVTDRVSLLAADYEWTLTTKR